MARSKELRQELRELDARRKEIERLMVKDAREEVWHELQFLMDNIDKFKFDMLVDVADRLRELGQTLRPEEKKEEEKTGKEVEETSKASEEVEKPKDTTLTREQIAEVIGNHAKIQEILDLAEKAEQIGTRTSAGQKVWPKVGKHHMPPYELVRDNARKLWRFTPSELAASLGMAPATNAGTALIDRLKSQGVVKEKGKGRARAMTMGKPSMVYEYNKPTDPGPGHDNLPRPGKRVSSPVPGTGKKVETNNKELNNLLDEVRRQGGVVTRSGNSGHLTINNPATGKSTNFTSTPSHADFLEYEKTRLRKIGFTFEKVAK